MGSSIALPLALGFGSSVLGGLSAPEGTNVVPLRSLRLPTGPADTASLLEMGIIPAGEMVGDLLNRAQSPINLRSSFAQQPPAFSGGGLPMPIGVTGIDPALTNPSLRSDNPSAWNAPFPNVSAYTGAERVGGVTTRRTTPGSGTGTHAQPRPPGQEPDPSAGERSTDPGGGGTTRRGGTGTGGGAQGRGFDVGDQVIPPSGPIGIGDQPGILQTRTQNLLQGTSQPHPADQARSALEIMLMAAKPTPGAQTAGMT